MCDVDESMEHFLGHEGARSATGQGLNGLAYVDKVRF